MVDKWKMAVASGLLGLAFVTGITTSPLAVTNGMSISVSSDDATSIHRDNTQDDVAYQVQGLVDDDDDDDREVDGPTESTSQVTSAGV